MTTIAVKRQDDEGVMPSRKATEKQGKSKRKVVANEAKSMQNYSSSLAD